MDHDKLIQSLEETLKVFPMMGGVLRKEMSWVDDSREIVRVDHYWPSVEFVVEESDEDYPSSKQEIFSFASALPFQGTFDDGLPVMKVKLVHFTRFARDILCICVCHGVVDLQSCVVFLKYWSAITRNAVDDLEQSPKIIEFDRSILAKWQPPPDDPHILIRKPIDSQRATFLGFDSEPFLRVLPQMVPVGSHSIGFRSFEFNQTFIDYLKASLEEQLPASKSTIRFSANDVLCAYMWKVKAMFTSDNLITPTDAFPFVFVLNGKGRMQGVDMNYFGNLLTHPWILMSKSEVMHSRVIDLAIRINARVKEFRSEDFKQLNDFVHRKVREIGWSNFLYCKAVPLLAQGFFVTNWSKFGLYSATDFGVGIPSDIHYVAEGNAPNVSIIQENPRDSGLVWRSSFHESTLQMMEQNQIASVDTAQRILAE
eukprot:TRINITY_DN5634_c1_g2_i1.p1 TRINITY_DN5634_c1_g2~~TRINITY_DN5634_c1_g2_i1.p1  ORF type:complete len:469 (+),score=100.58 TRINITY_DN5634_c1_g2_i1:132-1409(+)